jgi:hypothetical protein
MISAYSFQVTHLFQLKPCASHLLSKIGLSFEFGHYTVTDHHRSKFIESLDRSPLASYGHSFETLCLSLNIFKTIKMKKSLLRQSKCPEVHKTISVERLTPIGYQHSIHWQVEPPNGGSITFGRLTLVFY